MSLSDLFRKMKHRNRDEIGYRVIGVGCLIEKDLELSPSSLEKIPENYCPGLFVSTGQIW